MLGQFLLLKKNKDLFVEWIKVQRMIGQFCANVVLFLRTLLVLTQSSPPTATSACQTGEYTA